MNTKKILSAVVLTAAAASGAVASNVSQNNAWSFYAGIDTGVSFDRYKSSHHEAEFEGMNWKFAKDKSKKSTMAADFHAGTEFKYQALFVSAELLIGIRTKKFEITKVDADNPGDQVYHLEANMFSLKNNLNFGGILKVGGFVLPKLCVYTGIGFDCAQMRYKHVPDVTPLVNAVGSDIPIVIKDRRKGRKIACFPVIALGTRWDFSERFYTRLEYNYCFPKRIRQGGFRYNDSGTVTPVDLKVNTRLHSQIVKLGFGVRF